MKKIFLSLLLLPLISLAQNGFKITGNVVGVADGEVKITSTQDNRLLTKGPVKNGVFTVTGNIPEPGLYWIQIGKEQAQHIFLENKNIVIAGNKKDIKHLKIEGSQSQKDFEEFKNIFNPLMAELSGKAALINKATDEKKYDMLMVQYDSLTKRILDEVGSFVQRKPSSFVSPFLLFITAQIAEEPLLMEQRYNMLDSSIRNSNVGKSLAEFIVYSKIGTVGSAAPDFTQGDVDDQPVSLSSFKGKYVLVDFWASWCGPCRKENPNVVKAYQKFNSKNFTVLGVSLDKQKAAWLEAIKNDGLTWTHVSDLQYWNNAVAVMYKVQSIPQNFLIDPNGIIIAKNLTGEELEAKLTELLGKN